MSGSAARSRPGAWEAARQLAGRTPAARNRYVDFLRALSILAVVAGHWLIAAPHMVEGRPSLGHMLGIAPWTQWLTWGFQVMPVFFVVGGYANAASWSAAVREGRSYPTWLGARLRRLLGPLMPLLIAWTLLGIGGSLAGVSPAMIRIGSQAALVPTWFLAVYILVVLLVPLTRRAWSRLGMGSFWLLAGAAVVIDAVGIAGGLGLARWLNYLFVWTAVHQIGYAWRDGRIGSRFHALAWAAGGLAVLGGLVRWAGYPHAMVGVPGDAMSNTMPPTVAMLALAGLQGGLLLAFESPMRRWLRRTTPWTATVLINGTIMTVYLWHLTVMVLVIGLAVLGGGVGLGPVPGSAIWWFTRPWWLGLLAAGLLPFLALFGGRERGGEPRAELSPWRLVPGAVLVCGAVAVLAYGGMGAEGRLGIRWGVVLVALAGASLAGVRLLPRRRPAS